MENLGAFLEVHESGGVLLLFTYSYLHEATAPVQELDCLPACFCIPFWHPRRWGFFHNKQDWSFES